MHATRARLPQKRTSAKKAAAKKSPAKKAVAKRDAQVLAVQLPAGVASLAAHRAARPQRLPVGVEITAQVAWIAPARDDWRRGELEVRRTACMPMTATAQPNGTITLTDLPGQGDALRLDATAIRALLSGAMPAVRLALPGMQVTLTADDLRPALPAPRKSGQVLAFPARLRG